MLVDVVMKPQTLHVEVSRRIFYSMHCFCLNISIPLDVVMIMEFVFTVAAVYLPGFFCWPHRNRPNF